MLGGTDSVMMAGRSTTVFASVALLALGLWGRGPACGTPPPPPDDLADADKVRLEAVLEATSDSSGSTFCLGVDPSLAAAGASTEWTPADPAGPFGLAVRRLGHIYPQSKCAKTQSPEGEVLTHPDSPSREGVLVLLGPVVLSRGGDRAHLWVHAWRGELGGELRLLHFAKRGSEWLLDRNVLLMQE